MSKNEFINVPVPADRAETIERIEEIFESRDTDTICLLEMLLDAFEFSKDEQASVFLSDVSHRAPWLMDRAVAVMIEARA